MLNLLKNSKTGHLTNLLKEIEELVNKIPDHENQVSENFYTIKKSFETISKIHQAVDNSIIVAVTNTAGQILYINHKFCEISQYTEEEVIGKTHRIINSGFHSKDFFADMWNTILSGQVWEGQIKNQAKDGSFYWVKTTNVPILDENQKPSFFVSLRTDITKMKELEEQFVKAMKNDFNLILNTMHNFVFKVEKDSEGHYFYQFGEGKLLNQLGFTRGYIFNKRLDELFDTDLSRYFQKKYDRAFKGETITYDFSFQNFRLFTTLSPVYENGKINAIIGCVNDMTELNNANKEIEYLAFHDTLTNLPNRRKFQEDISDFINKNTEFSLYLIDLDSFKLVNDSLGHNIGDELLKIVSKRLDKMITINSDGKARVYRYSGDEFIILLPEVSSRDALNNFSTIILHTFNDKISIGSKIDLFITASMGISIFPHHGKDMNTLFKNADIAMYAAKSLGKNGFKIYDQELDQAQQKIVEIGYYLRSAIVENEFELYYQPKLNMKSNVIESMEALLRWHSPVLGEVPPDSFIKIAEENGLIWEIDRWVLETACEETRRWNELRHNKNPLRVAVNISPTHFVNCKFSNMVIEILNKTQLKPELLEIEVTETTLISNPEQCMKNIKALRDLGIMVSIDDFGTGYTSLNYIKNYSMDYLKIDRSYVRDMLDKRENWVIVKTIINLAHDLNLKVVAEGVEHTSILEALLELGCDEIQGYLISCPLPRTDFEKLLNEKSKQGKQEA